MFEVPDSMSDEDAAAFMIPAHTAWHAVHRRGKVQAGETVGGDGRGRRPRRRDRAAVRGRGLRRARGRRRARRRRRSSRGSARGPSTTRPATWSTAIRAATDGRGVDVIVDPVQGEIGARVRDLLVPDGRHVLCGHAGGLIAHDPHFYVRNHTLVGATLGGYPRDEMTRIHAETQAEIEALMADGRYRPLVSRVVDFADVPAAITDLAERRTWGRVVVRI